MYTKTSFTKKEYDIAVCHMQAWFLHNVVVSHQSLLTYLPSIMVASGFC